MVVYKYQLNRSLESILELPKGAEVLKVDVQNESICLWALVDPNAQTETRTFEVFGTGHQMDECKRRFINTFFVHGGQYVFHAFERL